MSAISSLTYRIDSSGCFSRPDESVDQYLSAVAGESRRTGEDSYPDMVRELFTRQFMVNLQKVPIEESSEGLMPWELACCWIDDEGRGGIQVRPASSYSKIPLQVVLFHEAIHAVRGRLDSTIFEEILAYAACRDMFRDSFPWWRMWTGPFFSSVREVIVVLLACWAMWFVPIMMGLEIHPFVVGGANLLIFLILGLRLNTRWRTWKRAMGAIVRAWPNKAWALMIRMSDEEIYWLASLRKNNVKESVLERSRTEWRWKYFLQDILEG